MITRALAFGFVSGLLWSFVAGFLADLFAHRADVPATIVAGVVAGIVTSAILALLVARSSRGLTVLFGLLSLPLGAFVFGFTFGVISRWLPILTGGTRELIDPWTLGSNYALLSVISIFAIGLFPLAVVTTLLLRAFIGRGRRMELPSRFPLPFLALAAFVLSAAIAAAAQSPLADAAEKQDSASVRTLLKQNADVNAAQPDGMTALHWAAYLDDVEIAKALAEAKANAGATNRYGVTPLTLACQNGNTEIVELLLAHGADANTTLLGGETVLMTAARTGKPGPVKALLKRGADVNAKERRGQTALMWAAADGHAEVVELLLKADADFRTPLPASGFTPLLFAAREGRADVVRVLLKAGADVNEAMLPQRPPRKGPRKGTSALLLAVENGHFELAVQLLEAGADPNDQRSGFTPLHAMTWVRKPQRGEDEGDPAPLGSGNLNTVQFIKELVKHGADVNRRLTSGKGGLGKFDTKGATPFLMASATADVPYMQLLLELGADPSIANVDNCTPLMVACGIGVGSAAANEVAGEEPEVLEAAQLLLKLGADVNAVDANGETAMHGAALKNLPKVVQFLANNGAKAEVWNRKNKFGSTPLMFAQGYRPGNFKPSFETIDAVQRVMLAAGVALPTNTAPTVLRNSDWEPLVPVKKKP